jgi:outer membrane lipoprotein SlyB
MRQVTLPLCNALLGTAAAMAFALAGCTQAPQPVAPAAAPPATAPAPAPAAAAAAPAAAATPAAEVAPAPATEAAPAPAATAKHAVHKVAAAKHVHHVSHAAAAGSPEPTAAPARQPMTVCTTCGVVTAITPVKTEGKGTAIGVVAGGLAGLVVGNQIGGGNGRTIAKVAGAAGGALLGNKIEKKVRAETNYEIKVRLDDGTETTVTQETEPKLAVGAAVRIVDGAVVAK